MLQHKRAGFEKNRYNVPVPGFFKEFSTTYYIFAPIFMA